MRKENKNPTLNIYLCMNIWWVRGGLAVVSPLHLHGRLTARRSPKPVYELYISISIWWSGGAPSASSWPSDREAISETSI